MQYHKCNYMAFVMVDTTVINCVALLIGPVFRLYNYLFSLLISL